jgi:hypothetical protein
MVCTAQLYFTHPKLESSNTLQTSTEDNSLMLLIGVENTGKHIGCKIPFSLMKASKHRHTLFRFIFLASASASARI